MAIALIVSFATFTLIEVVMKRSGEVGARVETTAAGRTAMDQISRQLRSQVCAKRATMTTPRSIDGAGPAWFAVFTDFTNENVGGGTMPAPDLRTVSWANKILTEIVVKGTRDKTNNRVAYTSTSCGTHFPGITCLPSTSHPSFLNISATKSSNGCPEGPNSNSARRRL